MRNLPTDNGIVPAASEANDTATTQTVLTFDDNRRASTLFGQYGQNLALIERRLGVVADSRGNQVTIEGSRDGVERARRVLEGLYEQIKRGHDLAQGDVEGAIRLAIAQGSCSPAGMGRWVVRQRTAADPFRMECTDARRQHEPSKREQRHDAVADLHRSQAHDRQRSPLGSRLDAGLFERRRGRFGPDRSAREPTGSDRDAHGRSGWSSGYASRSIRRTGYAVPPCPQALLDRGRRLDGAPGVGVPLEQFRPSRNQ